MASFSSFVRRRGTPGEQTEGRGRPEPLRHGVPAGFEAVGEALASGLDPCAANAEVGRAAAQHGMSLEEALEGLRQTYRTLCSADPGFTDACALSVAWNEQTLQFLHRISCDDPLTGLGSLAHLRTRLAELYSDADELGIAVSTSHALVVVDVRPPRGTGREHQFTRALRLVEVGEAMRTVFPSFATHGRLGTARAAVLVSRSATLGTNVARLRDLLVDLRRRGVAESRVWIEGLPGTLDALDRLVDELAR